MIFIAGAHGVAGDAIVRTLKERGFTNLLTPNSKELDLRTSKQVEEFFSIYKPKYVFHTAARMGSIVYRNAHPAEVLLENLVMQANVIQSAHTFKAKKLLFMSSDFIYPESSAMILHEADFLNGLPSQRDFPYSLAKITGVKLCDYFREEYGDAFFTVVPCAFFGRNSSFNLDHAGVVAALISRMHQAKIDKTERFVLWGSGKPVKEFLFSDDLAAACVLLMESQLEEGLYNIGSGSGGTSIWDLAQIIKEVIGYKGEIICDLSKPDGIAFRVTDTTRIRSLGWRPAYDLKAAIHCTYQYFLESAHN